MRQSYADDLQDYIHCMAAQDDSAVGSMSRTLAALQIWMSANCLRLNPAKTQLIWFGTPQQPSKIDLASLALKYPPFTLLTTIRDLGVTLEQELTFTQQIIFSAATATIISFVS